MFQQLFLILFCLTIAQRLVELIVSRRHQLQLASEGFVRKESGGQYRTMVMLHVGWFFAMLVEFLYLPKNVPPLLAIVSFTIFISAQGLRFWVLRTLGVHWNTSVMAPADGSSENQETFVATGPYRYIRHPNYLAIILEIFSLPVLGGAYLTAISFSALNALMLTNRIKREELFLFARPGYAEAMREKGSLLPRLI